ncbi:MAG: D-aminoacylase [Clostridiaceae bacterium]|nr:D-aminoacylase [Clostridiaceae bacterium]
MYDLVLKGGLVYDGTGSKPFIADVAVKDGVIAEIGPGLRGKAQVELSGLSVAPGFIDIHSHSDTVFIEDDRCQAKLFQGVTTELSGQCGSTIYPCPIDKMDNIRKYAGADKAEWASESLFSFLQKAEKAGIHPCVSQLPLIGHGALRCGVMGFEDRKATQEELDEMCTLLDREMAFGAWGLSLGLGYTPGLSADIDELCALGAVVAKYGGIITSHMRDQGEGTPKSLEEMFEINRRTGAHVHIAHFKASGNEVWGRAPEFEAILHKAAKDGINVTADLYPYNASSSGITNSFPKWAIQGGLDKAVARLDGPESVELMAFLNKKFQTQRDGEGLYIVTTNGKYPVADGKNIWQLSQELGLSMADTIAKVTKETGAATSCIAFAMNDDDVHHMLSQNDFCIGSDGSCYPLDPSLNKGKPHPRNFGTFPRFLRLAREGLCPMETAVRRITGLSAETIGVEDRGFIKKGMTADITVFDENTVTDTASFEDPISKPEGIIHVFVGGKAEILNGEQTGVHQGRVVLKKVK